MKLSQLAAVMAVQADKSEKVLAEVVTLKVAFEDLKTQIADAEVTPEIEAAANRIGASLDRIDSLNEDTVPTNSES